MSDRAKTPTPLPSAILLAGPTGVGKTEIALRLARRHPFELISADSMQVYRGMEIGTAQPRAEELGGVALHGCGVLRPDDPFSVKRFLDISSRAHEAIVRRGRVPLYVGGTGMYLRALRWGLFEEPRSDPNVRERLEREARELGPEALHERLRSLDPALARRIARRDAVRIVRALEVAETAGRPLSALQTQWSRRQPRFEHRLFILTCPREALIERIERRVDAMLAAGWIDEVRRLLAAGYPPRLHSFKALGYRQIIAYLHNESTEDRMRSEIKAMSRQFAKRQMTWFRKEDAAEWIEYDGREIDDAVEKIEKLLAPARSIRLA